MESKKPFVVGFVGGPGVRKSTLAGAVWSLLKSQNVCTEMAREFVKDPVYDGNTDVLRDQWFIAGSQHMAQSRLYDKVEVIVTDSPLVLQYYYGKDMPESFHKGIADMLTETDNLYFYLERSAKYETSGRLQSYEEACAIDRQLEAILEDTVGNVITLKLKEGSAGIIEAAEYCVEMIKEHMWQRAIARGGKTYEGWYHDWPERFIPNWK